LLRDRPPRRVRAAVRPRGGQRDPGRGPGHDGGDQRGRRAGAPGGRPDPRLPPRLLRRPRLRCPPLAARDGHPPRLVRPLAVRHRHQRPDGPAARPRRAAGRPRLRQRVVHRHPLHRQDPGGDQRRRQARRGAVHHRPRLDHRHRPVLPGPARPVPGGLRTGPVTTADYPSAGEPFRIVTGGVPAIPGATVLERRANTAHVDHLRKLLVNEPRGHADMYGCFLVPPDDPGAHLGALFWHKDGYSTACGHGTIALGVHAVREGLVQAAPDGETDVIVDVPSGRVTARVRLDGGRVTAVTFVSVPSYVIARGVPAAGVKADLAYGGAIYASVPAAAVGLEVRPEHLTELIAWGRRVKAALADHPAARHPGDDRLSGVYGVIFHDELDGAARQRNVTVFADGEVDRSPCGSGTAARLALLHEDGLRGPLRHESIVGTAFLARVAGVTAAGVFPEIEGMAWRTRSAPVSTPSRPRSGPSSACPPGSSCSCPPPSGATPASRRPPSRPATLPA